MTELIDMRPQHIIDATALGAYLSAAMPDLKLPVAIKQFQGGQSNPTYLLTDAAGRRLVLRKKPPGAILPSAHAIEREYAAMRALRETAAPVPEARILCEDPNIIGTPFYVMDYIAGRVFTDIRLTELPVADRAGYYHAMIDGLAALHSVDWKRAGLDGFGRPEAYVARQIGRWTKQYLASSPESNPDMEALIAWLPANIPDEEPPTIAHGDYRLGNLMFAPHTPDLLAILDWELATIGNPLSDLAYLISFYRLPGDGDPFRGLAGLDLHALGIPSETDILQHYCARTGRDMPSKEWPFYLAFSLFRSAAIGQGVYDRSRRGNAADARANLYLGMVGTCSGLGWQIAQGK